MTATKVREPRILIETSEPGVYLARSQSHPNVLYRVTGVGTPFVCCGCPAAEANRSCWHRQEGLAKGGFFEAVAAEKEIEEEEKDMTVSYKARAWDQEKDGSGEFAIPEVDDGTYHAIVKDVEDKEFPGYEGGPAQLKYMIKWEFTELVREDGEPVTLTDFVTIPSGLIHEGYLHPKARLFARLKALGYDPAAPNFDVDPMDWIGKSGKVWVKNVESKTKKDPEGNPEVRPQIVDVTPWEAPRRTTATVRRTVAQSEPEWGDGQEPIARPAQRREPVPTPLT